MKYNYPIKPAWTPLSIALMVLGFIVFWPLGLAMLAWICWGERMVDWWDTNRSGFQAKCGRAGFGRASGPFSATASTGNEAFEEYRRNELERLDRERRKLEDEAREFETYIRELRKARDREEFDRYMRDRRDRQHGTSPSASHEGGEPAPAY